MSKSTSSENPVAMPGASIILNRDRLMPAFSANLSCDKPLSFLNDEIAIPNWMNRSLFLNDTSLLITETFPFPFVLLYFFPHPVSALINKHLIKLVSNIILFYKI